MSEVLVGPDKGDIFLEVEAPAVRERCVFGGQIGSETREHHDLLGARNLNYKTYDLDGSERNSLAGGVPPPLGPRDNGRHGHLLSRFLAASGKGR